MNKTSITIRRKSLPAVADLVTRLEPYQMSSLFAVLFLPIWCMERWLLADLMLVRAGWLGVWSTLHILGNCRVGIRRNVRWVPAGAPKGVVTCCCTLGSFCLYFLVLF